MMTGHARHVIGLTLIAGCMLGCDQSQSAGSGQAGSTRPASTSFPETPAIVDPRPATASNLDQAMSENGMITFRSHGGRWLGGDSDTDLTLFPGGRVHMSRFGYALTEHEGLYTIDTTGAVVATFADYGSQWPVLMLQRDQTSLLLLPLKDGKPPSKEVERYSAFRPIFADEQAKVRMQLQSATE